MVRALEDFCDGLFEIEFVGGLRTSAAISHPVSAINDHILYLVGKSGWIYNWSTIICIKRVEE